MDVWEAYSKKTKDIPPRPLLIEALPYVSEKGFVLDMGSGALNDSRYLVEQGFDVIALDKKSVVEYFNVELPQSHFEYVIEPFETYVFPVEKFYLVNAQFSLPFISPDSFSRVFSSIKTSLKQDGIFVGQLFGDRDDWKNNPAMTFCTKEKALGLFSEFELLKFLEEERDGKPAVGEEKHWHIFHFIARK